MMRFDRIARGAGRAVGVAAATGAALVLGAAAASAGSGGSVLSAKGAAYLHGGDGRAALACGATVGEGERLVTGEGGRVAFSVGELYVQLGPDSAVRLGEQGQVQVESGHVRAVDLGENGETASLRTPHAWLQTAGFDADVFVEGDRSLICESRGRVEVGRTNASGWGRVEPGSCALVDGDSLMLRPASGPQLELSGAEGCVDVDIAGHFQPADVAAPPPGMELFPLDPDKRTFNPCEANGCGGSPQTISPPSPPSGPPDLTPGGTPAPGPGGDGPPDLGGGGTPAPAPGGDGPPGLGGGGVPAPSPSLE